MIISAETKDLFKAISDAQGEFTTVEKGKDNPFFKSKYTPLDAIIEMVRPILPKHGLGVVQFNDVPENRQGVIIETVITHSSGQFISGRLLMPMAKVDPQGAGSAITYGRRYALAAALGIVSDEDVDGNGHAEKGTGRNAPPAKSPPPPKAPPTSDTPAMPKANQSLYDELAAFCTGDTAQIDKLLKQLSHYESDGKEYSFGLDRLPKTSEKWAGKVLGAARAYISEQTDIKADEDIPF